jgi:hypothetical protein
VAWIAQKTRAAVETVTMHKNWQIWQVCSSTVAAKTQGRAQDCLTTLTPSDPIASAISCNYCPIRFPASTFNS